MAGRAQDAEFRHLDPLAKAGADALLAVKCCLENRRRADFLEWSVYRVAAA